MGNKKSSEPIISFKDLYVGLKLPSRNYGCFSILKIDTHARITICFENTGYVTISACKEVLKGSVKDNLAPSVYGVGYIGIGVYKSRDSEGTKLKAYSAWKDMLRRCYTERDRAYKECRVHSSWHNFQNFAEWYTLHSGDGAGDLVLDKDKLFTGNRLYSPHTCCLISKAENSTIANKARALTVKLLSPEGEVVTIKNITEFCRGTSIDQSALCKLSNGERLSHKGWRQITRGNCI